MATDAPARGLTLRPRPARDHCLAPGRRVDAPLGASRYGRMFPDLPDLPVDEDLLRALGRAGGVCDASMPAGPSDDAGSDRVQDVAAWWPVFGQFVAHDITADRSPVDHHGDLLDLPNFRQPRANLECVYGEGPVGAPYLFDRADPAKLLCVGDDLPRNAQGTALVADPRQDVHVLISQLHLAMLRAHNRLVDRLRADGVAEEELYAEARRALQWHYQWTILHDQLPTLVGLERAAAATATSSARVDPLIPVEFADAAYRFGHCQMRETYQLQAGGRSWNLFPDLMGFGPVAPDRVVDWTLLADVGDGPARQPARPIDGRLPTSLLHLPAAIVGDGVNASLSSLATRDLLRGRATGLPSGEAVARQLGATPLDPEETGLGSLGWHGETPLWLYVVREAAAREHGRRLGDVGGHIVATTLTTIVDSDPGGYRAIDPGWRPTLPSREPGRFTLADLLVPPTPDAEGHPS